MLFFLIEFPRASTPKLSNKLQNNPRKRGRSTIFRESLYNSVEVLRKTPK